MQPSDGVELDQLPDVDPISETVEDLMVRRDLSRAVSKEMASLPPDQRTSIVLKEYHGLTFREIAELLGCPVSTAKTRLYQGLTVLRDRLAQNGVAGTAAREPHVLPYAQKLVREQ